jgi:hypothetical protein
MKRWWGCGGIEIIASVTLSAFWLIAFTRFRAQSSAAHLTRTRFFGLRTDMENLKKKTDFRAPECVWLLTCGLLLVWTAARTRLKIDPRRTWLAKRFEISWDRRCRAKIYFIPSSVTLCYFTLYNSDHFQLFSFQNTIKIFFSLVLHLKSFWIPRKA